MEPSAGMVPERKRPVINSYNTSKHNEAWDKLMRRPISQDVVPPVRPDDEVYVHKLRVGEAKSTDAGRNIIRIDASSLILLGIKVGDIVVIAGTNGFRAAALCLDSEIMEVEPVIRMDRVMRTNLGLALGDLMPCSSIKVVQAVADSTEREIILDPLVPKVPAAIDEAYLARALRGMPLVAGQAIVVPYFGGVWYPFIVLRILCPTSTDVLGRSNQPEFVAIVGPSTRLVFGASGLST